MKRLILPVRLLLAALAAPLCAQPVFQEITPTANPYFANPESQDFWLS